MPADDSAPDDRRPRRRFLRRLALATGAGAFVAGCGAGEGGSSTGSDSTAAASSSGGDGNQCVPPSELSQEAREGRQRYGYVAQTPEAGLRCDNCQFWIAPEESTAGNGPCGGCRLFAGPVHPEGYCTAYLAG